MLREIETRSAGYETVCQDLMEILIVLFGRQTNFFYDSQSRKQKSIPPLRFRSALY